ncbi:MAG TPA: Ig-like domain-containing protein, partial [bacterium]|nr:Ig-like domain-containing protein [bacterium]
GIIFNSENDTKVELLVGPNQTAIAMKDDGTSGDEIANDKVFTAQVVVGTDIYTGDTVNILITNKNGDTILYSISVEVDTEITQPSITSPQANSVVSGAVELKATGDADIIKARWYYYRSGLVQQTAVEKVLIAEIDGLSDTALMPTLALADDTYTILLTVIDRANNSVDTEIKVYVDNNRPEIYAISVEYPTANGIEQTAAKNGDLVRISALIQSEAQIDTVYIKVNNNDTTVFMTTPMNDGVYIANLIVGNDIIASANTLKIYAGNVNSDTTISELITVNIDNTAPTFTFSDLQNGDTISNSSLIGITSAADDIRRVIYNGSATRSGVTMNFDIADKTDTNKISFIWPQILGDGYCTITVKVYDKANNETTSAIVVWIDNTKPIVNFVNPAAHSYNSGNIAVNFTAVDTNIIKTVKVYVNGAIIADSSYSANSINDTFYWNTSNDSRVQGQVIFRVVAIDTVGNENYAERPIFIDNSRPTVSLLKPDTMTYISGVYQVRAITSNADELWYNIKGAGV